MLDLNKLLKNSNLYSIEYCGYFILKFSISDELNFYNFFQDISIEFISGNLILNNENKSCTEEDIFNFYGLNVVNSKLIQNNQIELEFENGKKIVSINESIFNELIDRSWVLKETNNENSYIINDTKDIFISNDIKLLLE